MKNYDFSDLGHDLASLRAASGLVHPEFGDLQRPLAVSLPAGSSHWHYHPTSPLLFHLSVTGRCWARCKGCINADITAGPGDFSRAGFIGDAEPWRDASALSELRRSAGGGPAVLCFYGGEPLLRPDIIGQVMAQLDKDAGWQPWQYMLYTNGELLTETLARQPLILDNMWLVSVSIDGGREQHQRVRPGTHLHRIHQGLCLLKERRRGPVLMWSTLREGQSLGDCFDEFSRLYHRGLVDQFFWHWVETDEPFEDFAAFARNYEEDLRRIMAGYLEHLAVGTILPICHINELLLFALSGRRRRGSGCGVELALNYDLIDGKIHSCADLPLQYAIGRITPEGKPELGHRNLSSLVGYKAALGCVDCGVHGYCGGRCPVQAMTGSARRLMQYCQLMRLHVGVVLSALPAIEEALRHHSLTAQDLYDQSALYSQFTDVIP